MSLDPLHHLCPSHGDGLGRAKAVAAVRQTMGATRPTEAAPGTLAS